MLGPRFALLLLLQAVVRATESDSSTAEEKYGVVAAAPVRWYLIVLCILAICACAGFYAACDASCKGECSGSFAWANAVTKPEESTGQLWRPGSRGGDPSDPSPRGNPRKKGTKGKGRARVASKDPAGEGEQLQITPCDESTEKMMEFSPSSQSVRAGGAGNGGIA